MIVSLIVLFTKRGAYSKRMGEEVVLTVLFVRHAESHGNVRKWREGDFYYKDNPPLTDYGIEQAKLLAKRLEKGKLDAMYSSTLERAVETAYECAKLQGDMPIILMPDLMENGTKEDYPGLDTKTVKEKYPLAVPCIREPTMTGGNLTLGIEDTQGKTNRAKRILNYIRKTYKKGETVALFSHGGFSKYFVSAALHIDISEKRRLSSNNSSVTKLKFYEDGTVKLSFLNDTSHLYEIKRDLTYTI